MNPLPRQLANASRRLASTRRALLLAATLAVATVGVAGVAEANVKFGINVGSQDRNVPTYQRMAQGDTALVRRSFDYTSNFQEFDNFMRGTSDAGLRVLPVVMGTPDGSGDPPRTAEELHTFRSYTRQLVDRYGRNGIFWCQSEPDIGPDCARNYRPVQDWQVLNEPSLIHFWAGAPNPREYARALAVANEAIESEDPRADTVLAGMPYDTIDPGLSLDKFMKKLYEVDGVKNDFDVATVHPYGRDEEDVRFILDVLRSRMDRARDDGTDIWVTEMGWATGGPPNHYTTDEAGQKQRLKRSFEFMQADRKRYNLDTVAWYNWRDDTFPHSPDQDRFYYHTGLFRADGTPKPSWTAFTRFTGGDDGGSQAVATSSGKVGVARDPLTTPPDQELPPPKDAAGQ